MNFISKRQYNSAFTIIELLVVIVVIGILATITIVGYSGIRNKAIEASLISQLNNASKQLDLFKVDSLTESYPISIDSCPEPTEGNACIEPDEGTAFDYTPNNSINPTSYTLVASSLSTGIQYYIAYSPDTGFVSPSLYEEEAVSYDSMIDSGFNHSCAISTGGDIYCWGENYYGQLGTNTSFQNYVPHKIITSSIGENVKFIDVASGYHHTCGLTTDGVVYCWGRNQLGQLGDGTNDDRRVPTVPVDDTGVLSGLTIKDIKAGMDYTCAIASDDKVYCWGEGVNSQLGNNSTANSNTPVAVYMDGVLSGLTVKSLAASGDHTCVIASDDKAYCWGDGSHGQLGNSSTADRNYPVAIKNDGVLSGLSINKISAGNLHTCAIASDNQSYCWGENGSGQLNNGLTGDTTYPILSNLGDVSGKNLSDIAAGINKVCAMDVSGSVYCWGGGVTSSATKDLGGRTAASIVTGGYEFMIITSDKNVFGWGDTGWGHLGDNNTSSGNLVNTSVMADKTIVSLSTHRHKCALDSDGLAYCWGGNTYGQLGDNSTTSYDIPVSVNMTGLLSGMTIKDITTGYEHTCVIASDDNAYCWGRNLYGQLGDDSTTNSSAPVAVSKAGLLSGLTIKTISSGDYHTCVIASDDNAYCWGYNAYGQLGNASTNNSSIPVAVSKAGVLSGLTIKEISAGGTHTCAIASNDNAYCWGWNVRGQLGDNSTTTRSQPIKVNDSGLLSGLNIIEISTGYSQTCAIASNNNIYCWGAGDYGQLGNNSSVAINSLPVSADMTGVLAGKTINSISSGQYHSCVLDSNGLVYCWGRNTSGQLGDGSDTNRLTPVMVDIDSSAMVNQTVKAINAGYYGTCAITNNDEAYCWGTNNNNYTGHGYNYSDDLYVPVPVFNSNLTF